MTSIYTQETMLFHTTFYVTNRSAECGLKIEMYFKKDKHKKIISITFIGIAFREV